MSKKSRAESQQNQKQLHRDAFVDELTKLTQKFGLKIVGCGCCGSPAIYEVEKGQKNGSYSHEDGECLRFS